MDAPADLAPSRHDLDAVRRRRAELGGVLADLRRAVDGDGDLASTAARLGPEFALHVEVTEGPGGLHQAILAGDLRLANQVAALAEEHRPLAAEIAAVVADPRPDRAAALLARMVRHRQRGADLVHEAFETDLGGGD